MMGANVTPADGVTETTKQYREDVGVIWQKHSDRKNMDYFTLRLEFTKEMLLKLLEVTPDPRYGKINYDLVAFPCDQKGNPRRPNFRIYEDSGSK
jgi:uncharacterized protein (DUF736 family)